MIHLSNYSSDSEIEPEENQQVLTEFPDYGQKHPDWISHLKGFASAKTYGERIMDFLEWQHFYAGFELGLDLLAKLKLYIEKSREETRLVGEKVVLRFAPTVFRGWMSMFMAFWKFSGYYYIFDNKCK